MNFDISEEQELLQETLKQYVENECPPTRIRELFDSGEGWDPDKKGDLYHWNWKKTAAGTLAA